jgi:translation initiation factor 2B subunit (eIF-2B alpha/beta/delta family)
MGMRIFSNLSVIRRYLLQEFKDAMTKRQERAAERAAELSETGQTISTEVPEV